MSATNRLWTRFVHQYECSSIISPTNFVIKIKNAFELVTDTDAFLCDI